MLNKKTQFTICIAIGGTLLIALFILLSARYVEDVSTILTADTNNSLLQSTVQGERHVTYSINTDLTTLEVVAASVVNQIDSTPQDIAAWLSVFTSESGFYDIAVCGTDGFGIKSNGKPVSMSKMPAFREAALGKTKVSHFYDEAAECPMISFDIPMEIDGQVVGVISAIKKTEYLDSLLNISTTVDSADAYLINSASQFIAIATNSDIPRSMKSVYDFITIDNEQEEVNQYMEGLNNSKQFIGEYISRGEAKLFAYTPIECVDGWYYAMVIPKSVVHKQISVITRNALMLMATFILSLTAIFVAILAYKNRHTREILNLAHIDQLTNIPNWNKFKIDCEDIIKRARNQRYAIVSFDIDSFKVINDIYGHQEGNKILINISQILQRKMMLGERCARYSGDTFLALLKFDSDPVLIEWIESFKDQLCEALQSYSITMSFGIYKIGDHRYPIDIMCDRANLARRTIKGDHERTYAFYQDETRRQIIQVKEIENDMHAALDNHQFTVYFQPKHSFSDVKQITGAEALTRWTHPIKGIIFPDMFIPVFERNGFIIHLDMYVLERTCEMIRRWLDNGLDPVVISVNMSQIHLKDPLFVQDLINMAERYNVPPQYIEIELTESAIFENMEAFTRVVSMLKQYGFTVSMDDFGSGYSSLNLLSELQVDVLKIDRMFLNKSSDSQRGKCIIESVIEMAKRLGIKTVSEGVETQEQVDFLTKVGCDIAQGYYFSRPLPPATFEEYLHGNKNKQK